MVDAKTYKEAASEHVTVARELYEAGRYVLANYVSGLAVECIFRAYRARINPEFDARHDLARSFKLAKFGNVVPESRKPGIAAALGTVMTVWSNENRFRSGKALRKRLVSLRLFERIKGDFVKEWTRRLVNAAADIVSVGVAQWKN